MMNTPENTFKRALRAGQQQYGYWLGLADPVAAEMLAHTGYDWLLIDGEHAPNDRQTVLAQLQAITGTPAHAVVRLPDGNPTLIKQYLDLGAQSLLIPMVDNAAQAEALVRAITYPPHGMRGVGTALARASYWNQAGDYFARVDQELCLLIQVESVAALENMYAILAVERVDGVFVGPADLAASMGYLGQPAHPEVKAAVETTIRKIRAAGKAAGSLVTSQVLAKHYEALGLQFVALGVDTLDLVRSAGQTLSGHRSGTGGDNGGNGAY